MRKRKLSSFIFPSILSALLFYLGNRFGSLYMNGTNGNIIERFDYATAQFIESFSTRPFYVDTTQTPLIFGFVFGSVIWVYILYHLFDRTNYLEGVEHGSARWGTPNEIKPMADKEFSQNILLTQTERMSMNTRKTMRNNNVLVIGGSGSGKTRFFVKPNLMQKHCSFVVTDPKGTLLPECGKMLKAGLYDIRYFNVLDFKKSMHYNPFAYIRKEKDILVLVNAFILNTSGKGAQANQDFWVQAEKLLYMALIGYIWYECRPNEQNFGTLTYLLTQMEAKEDDEDYVGPIDILFQELEEKDEEHFAVLQYKKYKKAAGKTAKSILISCGARLAPFDIKELKEITSFDELHLDTLGDEKTALFLIVDDKDGTFNFVVALLFTQLFSELCNKADNEYGGRLPFHVRILADEIMNIAQIPDFEKIISVIRSREISICPIVQNMAQIKNLYKDSAGTIVGNCDTLLFLGSGEEETAKSISGRVGKTTIDQRTESQSKGANTSVTLGQQVIARDLLTPDEVGTLPNDECLLFIRGLRPFKSKKFIIEEHPCYKQLSDFDRGNELIYYKTNDTPTEYLTYVDEIITFDADELNALAE